MTYESYRYIFIGAAILCGIMLISSVLLFVLLKIPKVIGDLTGSTAKKAIENIRHQNESSGDKTYRSSAVNQARGKLTDKISPSGNILKNSSESVAGAMATEKISTQQLDSNETVILNSINETEVLESGNETTVLSNEFQNNSNETVALKSADTSIAFEIEYEITYIHTNEIVAEV